MDGLEHEVRFLESSINVCLTVDPGREIQVLVKRKYEHSVLYCHNYREQKFFCQLQNSIYLRS